MLQSSGITIGDDLRGADVVPQRGQPEFRDRSGIGGIRWKFFVGWIVLERLLLSCLDLLRCWLCGPGDDRETAFIQRTVQAKVLPKQAIISNSVGDPPKKQKSRNQGRDKRQNGVARTKGTRGSIDPKRTTKAKKKSVIGKKNDNRKGTPSFPTRDIPSCTGFEERSA